MVSATPVGWIIGVAVEGGTLAYGASRMIHKGGLSEGQKKELLQKYQEEKKYLEAKEKSGSITAGDRTKFIISIRELISENVIDPNDAIDLIEKVEDGRIPISQAFQLIQSLLHEKQS